MALCLTSSCCYVYVYTSDFQFAVLGFRANIILWGIHRDISTLEVRAKLADLGLANFVRGKVAWEGDHLRLILTASDSKHITKEQVRQISWEKEDSRINVDGYKWFGKPHDVQNSQRGEGGVGFLVHDCLVNEVEFVSEMKYAESVWMKVRGETKVSKYIGKR